MVGGVSMESRTFHKFGSLSRGVMKQGAKRKGPGKDRPVIDDKVRAGSHLLSLQGENLITEIKRYLFQGTLYPVEAVYSLA